MTWRAAVVVPEQAAEAFAWALEPFAESVGIFGIDPPAPDRAAAQPASWQVDLWLADRCVVEILSAEEPDRAALTATVSVAAAEQRVAVPELVIEAVAPRDWVAETYRTFPEIVAGRYRIRGSHLKGQPPPGAIAITIDAATAFGTGEHETTRSCLLALDGLARRRRPGRVLDMGCGSGILAIAAARTWRRPVDACDIDPAAVRETRRNAGINGVAALVHAAVGDGYRSPVVAGGGAYGLILANVLARPLARMAPDLARHLAPAGSAVLSGLLAWQERQVLAAHEAAGLRLRDRIRLGDWSTLVVARR